MTLTTHRGEQYEYLDETGKGYFSVTQVRRCVHDSYAGIPAQHLKAAQDRGTQLHRRFWRVIAAQAGLVEIPSVIDPFKGYCDAMDRWVVKNNVRPVRLEHKSLNRKLGYAGQTDAQVLYGKKSVLTLADLKSGEKTLTDILQLLAYDAMEDMKSKQLMNLYIHEDGTYKEVFITARDRVTHWPVFLNALSLLKWRVGNGVM